MLKRVKFAFLLLLLCLSESSLFGAIPTKDEADAAFKEGQRLEGLQTAAGFAAAIESFLKASTAYHESRHKAEEAKSLYEIGYSYLTEGQPQKALEYLQKALPLQQGGDKSDQATTLVGIGAVYGATGQPQDALKYYQEALPLLQQVGDKGGEASTLTNIGVVYGETGQPQQALEYYQKALPLWQQAGDKRGEASTLGSIGVVYANTGQLSQALDYYQKALPLKRQVGDKRGEASTLTNIGAIYRATGQPQKALEYYRSALLLRQQVGDKGGEANALGNIGVVYGETGQPEKALENYQKALLLKHEVGDKRGEATTLSNIGVVYDETGQLQRALENYQKALPLRQQVGDKRGEAFSLNNIGVIYEEIGQWQESIESYQKALALRRQVGDKSGEAATLSNIGVVYKDTGRPHEALESYQKALLLDQQLDDKRGEAATLSNIGFIYEEEGHHQDALETYQKGLPLWQQVGDKRGAATALSGIAAVYRETGLPQKALEFYQNALPLNRQVGDRRGEAHTLANTAFLLDQLGQKMQARKGYEQAVEAVEAIVGSLSRDELKRSTTETYQWIYQNYIDFLLQQHNSQDNQKALMVSELARSRALRDLMAGNARQLPAASLLPGKSQPGKLTVSGGSEADDVSLSAAALSRGSTTMGDLLRSTPAVALAVEDLPPLLSARPAMPFQQEEAAMAATDGPVISYHILGKDLAIFVIEPSGELHVTRSSIAPGELVKLIQQARVAITANDDPSETRSSLARLYNVLLKPVERWITPVPLHLSVSTSPVLHQTPHPYPHTPILTIVPYGALFQVPFAALIGPGGHYLVERYALRTAPSLTVLRYTREQCRVMTKAPMNPAIYGDPLMPEGWHALPGAMKEVQQVASTLQTTRLFTGNAATEMAFRMEAPAATEIHLATHGYINPLQPQLSGVILAPSQGTEPLYERDGFLTVAEVFHLKLNARLVTLSACETGLGVTGADGVFGLQSAFLSAGSASLLSSLWKVSDQATSELMQQFYSRWRKDPGHNRAEALRQAQIHLLGTQEYRQPMYWAGFVLTGEAR